MTGPRVATLMTTTTTTTTTTTAAAKEASTTVPTTPIQERHSSAVRPGPFLADDPALAAAYMGAYSADNASTEDSPSSRSFLSRLSFPLRSRSRNLADFHIRPDEPHRQYAAGEHVRGAVVLAVVKPVRITHLTVSLHGYVKVYKGPVLTESVAPLPTSARFQYHGNGHASLFQDEQVLSGEGRLETGKYEFNFDLMFPEKGLPSSIDFERGTITYMITATLTRPTTISPTSTCDRKVALVERVDIGELHPPRPRTIYLEPISKRTKRKKLSGPEKAPATTDHETSDHESTDPAGGAVTDETSQEARDNPMSPVASDIRSEFSGDSGVSSSTGLSLRGTELGPGTNPALPSTQQNSKMPTVDEKTITATIELLKGGCLPGDTVPIKVSVQHIKRIKSMHGIIITLYRQGRIDSSPPSAAFTSMLSKEEARRLEKEDFYPRSKTGLGGLSLTSTTSLSVFRKDLSQAVAPLIIDPVTLGTSITASVKVPEDVFPTIKGVPGDMISFKYQVEVIVDLGGRLASQIQSGGQSSRLGALAVGNAPPGGDSSMFAAWSGSVVDTDRLRREKGVISVVFEVVVGTDDHFRQRGRAASRPLPPPRTFQVQGEALGEAAPLSSWTTQARGDEHVETIPYYATSPQPPTLGSRQATFASAPDPAMSQVPEYIPPPEVPDEGTVSEKEKLRRAEAMLLPSQPGGPSNAPDHWESPSAPPPSAGPYAFATAPPPATTAAPDSIDLPPPTMAGDEAGPSAPSLADLAQGSSTAPVAEDKQELERQRLLGEVSAPPDFPEDYERPPTDAPGPSAGAPSLEPTAPVLPSEEDDYGEAFTYPSPAGPSTATHADRAEPLPKYEK